MMRVACVALTSTGKGSTRRRECGHVFDTDRSNVSCPACRTRGRTIPWPTTDQLERMGFVRCEHEQGCSIFIDPENMPSRRCVSHARDQRRDQGRDRQPRVPYLPRGGRAPGRDAKPTRRDRIAERDGARR